MNVDEKIYSLMMVAEEQQKLTLEFVDEQKSEIFALKKEREAILELHQNNMAAIEKMSRKRISLTWMFVTAAGSVCISLLIALSASYYLKGTLSDLAEAEAGYERLRGFDADISKCVRNGTKYPCVRVMTSWGAYDDGKSNVADLYILDVDN